eukprot:TRINITY_DN9697_c0_g1_i3.p2 TRINITY_DN9697_c0_g1~~TRINITY_DN9697_c0_g1_i3.p2  ORF type:complete len:121 (-),score=26.63 TRINITY_DN9697_c0_g1_i3:38-400(-)
MIVDPDADDAVYFLHRLIAEETEQLSSYITLSHKELANRLEQLVDLQLRGASLQPPALEQLPQKPTCETHLHTQSPMETSFAAFTRRELVQPPPVLDAAAPPPALEEVLAPAGKEVHTSI